jgi:hypothetical protein
VAPVDLALPVGHGVTVGNLSRLGRRLSIGGMAAAC